MVAKDSSANGNNGELVGNLTWVQGKFGGALSFPGASGNFVNIPHNDFLSLGTAYSICAWIKMSTGSADPRILVKGALANTYSYYLTLRTSLKTAFMGFRDTGQGAWQEAWGKTNIMDDEWHHLAGTYDGKNMILYVDGKKDAEESHSGKPDKVKNPVTIGAESDGKLPFNGIIDDVAIFKVALTENEINDIIDKGLSDIASSVSPAGNLTTTWGSIRK